MDTLPGNASYFIFSKNKILLNAGPDPKNQTSAKPDRNHPVPQLSPDQVDQLCLENLYPTGMFDKIPSFSAHSHKKEAPKGFVWVYFRSVVIWMAPEIFQAAGFARQVHEWNLNCQFCGKCGQKLDPTPAAELVRTCQTCRVEFRPRISPAMIVSVTRGDQILLARGVDFPDKEMFSILAGYCEPCESLEETVRREVKEETGIQVKNIQYFKSQPWPFPETLMIGFTAEYDTGQLCISEDEIAEAAWFHADNLPKIPSRPTLSRALIDAFIQKTTLL